MACLKTQGRFSYCSCLLATVSIHLFFRIDCLDSTPLFLENQFHLSRGLPEISKTASFLPRLLPVSGVCLAGKQYVITSLQDLYDLIPEIECVWSQGLSPQKVPLGAAYGRLLAFANTAVLDFFSEFVYQGDYVVRTHCNGNHYNIGILNFGGKDLSTGIWTVSSLPANTTFVRGEVYDGKPGVLMDFTVSIEAYCPIEGNEVKRAQFLKGLLPFRSGAWPFNLFIDMLRTVGHDTDGCLLLLGRTWMLNRSRKDELLATVLFFTLKTCDPFVNPEFQKGSALPPLETSFRYSRRGAIEFLKRIKLFEGAPTNFTAITEPQLGLYPYHQYTKEGSQVLLNAQPTANGSINLSDSFQTVNWNAFNNPVFEAWKHLYFAAAKIFTEDLNNLKNTSQ